MKYKYEILNQRNDHLCYQSAENQKEAIKKAREYGIKTAMRARLVVEQPDLTSSIEYAYQINQPAKISKVRKGGWRVTHMEKKK